MAEVADINRLAAKAKIATEDVAFYAERYCMAVAEGDGAGINHWYANMIRSIHDRRNAVAAYDLALGLVPSAPKPPLTPCKPIRFEGADAK